VIVTVGRGGFRGVDFLNLSVDGTEALESKGVFLNISVGFTVFGNVIDEVKVLLV